MALKQSFGGGWTEKKLQILKGYLEAYTVAMGHQAWVRNLIYIDAFAGTGVIEQNSEAPEDSKAALFPEVFEADSQAFLDGSAKIALESQPPFHYYIFIEQAQWKAKRLDELIKSHPGVSGEVIHLDANKALVQLAKEWHTKDRGVVFIDPFGMALEWPTLEALAATKALDVWLLFPLGQAVSRMLTKTAAFPPKWEARLTKFFGTDEWRDAFYPREVKQGLFGMEEEITRQADYAAIEAFFRKRLAIFPFVHKDSLTMVNDKGVPLFLFMFMMSTPSEKAHKIGRGIAGHLVKHHT